MSLTIRSYAFLYIFIVNVIFHQVKMLTFYNAQTTNSTFVENKNMKSTTSEYSIMSL